MRFRSLLILCLCLVTARLAAAEDRRREQIQAAHTDALASMMDSIRSARLQGDLTVGQFLNRTRSEPRLRQSLQRSAIQLGATRWPNPDTCQVQLEVAGRDVAAELASIAADSPATSPVPAEVLRKQLADWDGRNFSASGAAMTPERAAQIPPGPEQPLWLSVPEADRRAVVQAAQRDAGRRAVEGLADVPVGDGKTVADALEVPAVRKVMQDWVAARPVVDLRFGPDGDVLVTLAAPAEELWTVFRQALSSQTEIPSPKDEAAWQRLHDEVVARLKLPTGRGALSQAQQLQTPRAPRRALPDLPPTWAEHQLDADGSASGEGSKLRLARNAESQALDDLRHQIEKLPLGDGRTIGDAAASDGTVATAIDRTLRRARTFKVDYGTNGTVKVRVGVDLRYLWQELNRR
jgi:hypothetical protein